MRCRRTAVRPYLAVGGTPLSAGALANSTDGGLFSSRQRAKTMLALPVEGLDRPRLAEFMALCGPVEPQLIITERRALALGLDASTPMALSLPAGADAKAILALVTDATVDRKPAARPASPAAVAAIQLVKLSQGLPAVLAANLVDHAIACEESIVRVEADAVAHFADHATRHADRGERSLGAAQLGHAHPLCRVPRRHRRQPGSHHRRKARFRQTHSGAAAFRLPDRRRIRLSALRLRRSASARTGADRRPRRRRHSISGAGRPRARPRQQDADISIAG